MKDVHLKRILAVIQHATLSDGLLALITGQPDMELVATVSTAEEVSQSLLDSRPDLSIVDMDMPDGLGARIIRDIRNKQPDAAIIALVSYEWDSFALDAVEMGALAFLPKDGISKQLLNLIRSCK